MIKILFIPASGFAHVTRTLLLANEFKSDYEVNVLLTPQFAELAKDLQLNTTSVDLPALDYQKFINGGSLFSTESEVDKFTNVYGKEIDRYQPDLIITSMPVAAQLAIKSRHLPHITVFDACNHPQYADYADISVEKKLELIERSKRVLGPYNSVAKKLGVSPERSVRELFTADYNVMPDLPSIFPVENLAENYDYMGPIVWKGRKDRVSKLPWHIDYNKPLVYVSMGSSGNSEHMKAIAEQLIKSPYQVVITTGNVIDYRELKTYERDGFHVCDFLPGDTVITSSDKTIVICHGGIGTVYQALENRARGIVIFPAHRQHRRIARQLEKAGLSITHSTDQIGNMTAAVEKLLNIAPDRAMELSHSDWKIYSGAPKGKALITDYICQVRH